MPTPLTAPELTVPHGFFTREGGASEGLWAGLNCGFGSGDAREAVAANRAAAAQAMGVTPVRLMTAHQVHSPRALTVAGPWEGDPPEADALVTAAPGLAIAVLTADCAPVLLEDAEAGVVAAAHAGWGGAFGGVLETTLAAMEALGAARARIAAAIGPCISQRHYEVGPEFLERFCDDDPDNARFFAGDPGAKPHFDLPGFCLHRLRAAGVAHCGWVGRCTYDDEARFFSYRRATHRGEGDYGRLISVIRLP